MSDNDQTPSIDLRHCPICDGQMAAADTICDECRGNLEKSVMAVTAQDYPPPARVVQSADEPADLAGASNSLEARLDAAVNDDLNLLPLAPVGDFVRSSAVATAAPPAAPAARPAATITAPARPAPVPTPVEMDIPAKALQPQNGLKLALIAVLISVLAAVLAAVVWSVVVPPQREPAAQETPVRAAQPPAPAVSTPQS